MFGMLSDRCIVTNIILLSTLGSALAVFIFWGLAGQVSLLVMFALLYGFFAGGFSATWPGVMKQLKREKPAVETGMIFGVLAGARGIGNVVSGPLSSVLVNAASPRDSIGVRHCFKRGHSIVGWMCLGLEDVPGVSLIICANSDESGVVV